MRLVDQVSAPGRAIAASLGVVNRAVQGITSVAAMPSRALGAMARDARRRVNDVTVMSTGLSLGIAEVSKSVYELEKNLNKGQAAGDLSLQQRSDLLKHAVKLNYDYAATASEIVEGANEILRSGLSYEQTLGSLNGILDTAQAMDVPISQASAAIVNAMVAQKMAMEDMNATMKSSIRMADLYAYALKETAGATLEDFTTSGKYFNPVAAAIGMSPGETMAWQIALAKAGIYGSSAGTGLRAAPVRVAAPSPKGREAFARLGINPDDFVGKHVGAATGDTIAAALEAAGFSAEGIEAEIDRIIADPKLRKSPAKLANAIIDAFGDELGGSTGQDRALMADTIQSALTAGVSEIDLYGVLKAMRDKGAGVADYAAIFGLHHASKMQAIDLDILKHYLEATEGEAIGTAKTMREIMMQGIVKAWNQFTAALEAMSIAFGKSGLLEDATNGFNKLADALTDLAEVNPAMLKFAGYGALALAALAPLGFAISGIASSLALLVNPLTLAIGAIGALAYLNWDFLTRSFTAFSTGFMDNLDPKILDGIASGFERLKAVFSGDAIKFDAGWSIFFRDLGAGTAEGINKTVEAVEALIQAGRDFKTYFMAAFGDGEGLVTLSNRIREADIGGTLAREWENAKDTFAKIKTIFMGDESLATILGRETANAVDTVNRIIGMIDKISAAIERARKMVEDFKTVWNGGLLEPPGEPTQSKWEKDVEELIKKGGGTPDRLLDPSLMNDNLPPRVSTGRAHISAADAGKPIIEPVLNYEVLRQYTEQAAGEVKNTLSVTAAPVVDSSSIDAALSKASALRAMLGGITPGGAAAPPTPGLSKFGGPRAEGGPVARGMRYLVGEEGPELFTPGSSGTITPNHALGGGSTKIVNHITISGGNAEEVVQKLIAKLDQQLMRSRQITMDGRPRYEFG